MEKNDLKTADSTDKPRRGLRPSRELRQATYDLWCLARDEALHKAAARNVPQNSNSAKKPEAPKGHNHSMSSHISRTHFTAPKLFDAGRSGAV